MPIVQLPRALLSLLSLLILGAAVYLIWSGVHGYDVRDIHRVVRADGSVMRELTIRHMRAPAWRLWVGGGLLG